MGPDHGSAYEREMATMAKGASPGIVRTTPPVPAVPPPAFNADALCSKCGFDDISTSYRRTGYDCGYPRRCGMSQFDGEHLDRRCRRCGFGWCETVIAIQEHREGTPRGVPYQAEGMR